MKKILFVICCVLALSVAALAQSGMKEKAKPTETDKTEAIPTTTYLKRGAPIGASEKVLLNDVFKDPAKFAGKNVLVEGIVVRSCKAEGCWAEVAQSKESKSVRIKMKDHGFFIPLNSAGALARVEGTVQVKTLSKVQVDHMVKDDGAKFETRNADGTVTEVSLEATGIELKRIG